VHEQLRRYRASHLAVAVAAWLIAGPALAAERREVREGDLVLRSKLMAAGELDPATAQRHDIPGGKNRAVLNVALVRASNGSPVRAVVTASSRGAAGERQKILLREVKRGAERSYLGSFAFTPGQALEFVVEARPAEERDGKLLSLTFRERMPPE
jgi:hypothetical protein